jgi:serine/threonine-protein phosphatase 2A regulatory subunit A
MTPIVKKLASDEWFSSKCSDSGIIPVLYKYVSDEEEKALLRSTFLTICRDDTPMVRKYSYEHLGEFFINAGTKSARAELAEGIRNLMEEIQENLRILAVDVTEKVVIACKNDIEEFKDLALPLVDHVSSEISWRVRKQLAKTIGEIAANFPRNLTGQVLVPIYVDLLKDSESEVRLAAIKSMALVAKSVDEQAFSNGIGVGFEGILDDNSQAAKVSFSEVILDVAISCGKNATMKTFLPLIIKLMDSDIADMKGNVLEKLGVLSGIIGASEVVAHFLPKLLPLSKDPKWRVRKLVLENVVNFTRTVGIGTFEASFKPILLDALNDSVFGVREVAAKQFPILTEIGGHEWMTSKLLPEVLNLNANSPNYLHRMVPLLIIFELLNSSVELSSDYLSKHFGPVVLKFAQDPVANVRIFCVKTLAVFVKKVDSGYLDSKLKPVLMTFAQDSDTEVKLAAARVMKSLHK